MYFNLPHEIIHIICNFIDFNCYYCTCYFDFNKQISVYNICKCGLSNKLINQYHLYITLYQNDIYIDNPHIYIASVSYSYESELSELRGYCEEDYTVTTRCFYDISLKQFCIEKVEYCTSCDIYPYENIELSPNHNYIYENYFDLEDAQFILSNYFLQKLNNKNTMRNLF